MDKLFVILFMLFSTNYAVATNDVFNTQTKNSMVSTTIVSQAWDLTDTEWNQYEKLMQGPSGHYYTQLTPPAVLGIFAESKDDLQHYAEIAAKFEHDKLERELRFNAAFHDAAAKLYANEPIVQPFDYARFTPIPK